MIHAPEVPEDWRVCQNQAGQNIYCIADLSKRGVLHTSPLYTILATIKSCHCLILWFRQTSAVAAAHIAATDDARANGGQTEGWRADGGIETHRAPSHPSRFSWGGRFSALKPRMRFFSPQIAVVFSREHMYCSLEWMSFFSWCKLTKFSQLSG